MRVLANLFLILFFADGAISLAGELVSLLVPLPALSGLRNFLENLVLTMAIPVYLSLGIDKRLPKRVFLPLIIYLLWCPLAPWFFPFLAGSKGYGLLSAAGQVFLCLLPVYRFRQGGEYSLVMTKALFNAPFFSFRNTLVFGAANLVVIPVALALFVLYSANSYVQEHTSGFMRISPYGLHMTERVYRRDGKTIRLAAMIHVGEKEYYEDMAGSVTLGRTIVLAEGVTDDKKLVGNRIDYGRFAGFLGLTSQENLRFKGKVIGKDEHPSSLPGEEGLEIGEETDILRADVDVSSFNPQTIRFLDALGRHLKETASMVRGVMSFNAWAEKNITPEIHQIIMDDILYGRNKVLIRHLRKALERYDTIVIPWGALHMPEIESEVLNQGFELRQEQERVSIDFKKMLGGKGK